MLYMLRMWQYRLAIRVYFTLQVVDQSQDAKLCPVLVLTLAGSNASSLARKLNRYPGQWSKIERSMHVLDYQMKSPSVVMSLKAVTILTHQSLDRPSICLAAQNLVHAQCLAAAKLSLGRRRTSSILRHARQLGILSSTVHFSTLPHVPDTGCWTC
jgi:hypothetical protein